MKKFLKDERGLSTLEYIIGAGVMAGLSLAVFLGLQSEMDSVSKDVENAISTAGDTAANGGSN